MTFKGNQLQEGEGNILIAVVDETYDRSEDDDWEQVREAFRLKLEKEHGLPFEDGNIGPGADFPAFITLLQSNVHVPLWVMISSIFFLGEPLTKNFDAWREISRNVRSLLTRPAYLNRQGAAVLAFEAVTNAIGKPPKILRLISYRIDHMGEQTDLDGTELGTEIMDAADTLYLGFIRHIFEIEADGVQFRVCVNGREAKAHRLN